MLGKVINILVGAIVRPGRVWKLISKNDFMRKRETFYNRYLYPTWMLIAVLSFAGIYFSKDTFDFQFALRTFIANFVSLCLSFYLSVFLFRKSTSYLLNLKENRDKSLKFVGYSSFFIYFLNIFIALFPALFFLKIFYLYTFYAIWEGASVYMKIDERRQMKFSMFTFLSILVAHGVMFTIVGRICKV